MKNKLSISTTEETRRDVIIRCNSGVYRISGYDMLPHKLRKDDPQSNYDRITWEELRIALTKPEPVTK